VHAGLGAITGRPRAAKTGTAHHMHLWREWRVRWVLSRNSGDRQTPRTQGTAKHAAGQSARAAGVGRRPL